MPQHVNPLAKPKRRWPRVVGGIFIALFAVALGCVVAVVVVRPQPAIEFLGNAGISVPLLPGDARQASTPSPAGAGSGSGADSGSDPGSGSGSAPSAADRSTTAESRDSQVRDLSIVNDKGLSQDEARDQAEAAKRSQRTPLIARCSGVDMRCPVSMPDLTGILFHQASYGYALPLDTEIPEADYETVANTRTFRINHDQVAGPNDWADTEALHLWRTTDTTDPDTSIDIGSFAGTTAKAPVDGTVVLVKGYRLYEELDDFEIHIQPNGRPDLDCVLIHVSDPFVKAGDKVEAGVTDIARIRDIESALTDVQLGFFTPEGVGGNHTHVQMNNADSPDYREKKLEGAISPA